MIVAFIDELRAEGHAVESICRVLREQGCQVAARTYREWSRAGRPVAARTLSDAQVIDHVRSLAWRVDHEGVRRLTPEGLYGRRKMTALVRRTRPDTSPGGVDRAMRSLALKGIRRSKGVRTTIPAKNGKWAGDLLDRDFTYVRTWAGFVYTAFVLDVFAQKIVAWNVGSTKAVELVEVPLRIRHRHAPRAHPLRDRPLAARARRGRRR